MEPAENPTRAAGQRGGSSVPPQSLVQPLRDRRPGSSPLMSDKLQPTQNNLVLLTRSDQALGATGRHPQGAHSCQQQLKKTRFYSIQATKYPELLSDTYHKGNRGRCLNPGQNVLLSFFFFLFYFFSCLMKYKSPEQPVPGNACTYC